VLRRVPLKPARQRLAVALFVISAVGWVSMVASDSQRYWRQTDAVVYRDAGAAVLHGQPLYSVLFGPFRLPFTYPPFAGLLFAPFSSLPFGIWQVALAVVSIVSLVIAAHASIQLAGGTGFPGALVLAAVALWLEPVGMALHFGQLNLPLLALVLVDLASDRGRFRGVGIGLAAGIKLTPLIFIPYLWLTGRRRTAVVGLLTFLATVLAGFAVLPHDAARYWWHQVAEPGDGPERLVNQSLNGALLRLTHHASGGTALWLAAAVFGGVVGLTVAVVAARRSSPLLGVCLCAATGLLVSPVSWSHHWVYVVPALALVADPHFSLRARISWGVAVVALFGWWPTTISAGGPSGLLRLAPHDDGRELHWGWWQLTYGNYYVLAALVFVLGAALLFVRARGWQRTAVR
jgi:alpha-1,2-mannosyltransferase